MIVIVERAGAPFGDDINYQGQFDYGCFACVESQRGVYAFVERGAGSVLYVGLGGFPRDENGARSLKDRLKQHYIRTDSSHNFRRNWARENCSECRGGRRCSSGESCNFPSYLDLISQSRVICFCIDGSVEEARKLERQLGLRLRPQYSSHE